MVSQLRIQVLNLVGGHADDLLVALVKEVSIRLQWERGV